MGLAIAWTREQPSQPGQETGHPGQPGQDSGQPAAGVSAQEQAARELVLAHPAATGAFAALLGK